MNGMKPDFIEWNVLSGYYDPPNPYANAPSCHVNLLELSRYAEKVGKKIVELTEEEVDQFRI